MEHCVEQVEGGGVGPRAAGEGAYKGVEEEEGGGRWGEGEEEEGIVGVGGGGGGGGRGRGEEGKKGGGWWLWVGDASDEEMSMGLFELGDGFADIEDGFVLGNWVWRFDNHLHVCIHLTSAFWRRICSM